MDVGNLQVKKIKWQNVLALSLAGFALLCFVAMCSLILWKQFSPKNEITAYQYGKGQTDFTRVCNDVK